MTDLTESVEITKVIRLLEYWAEHDQMTVKIHPTSNPYGKGEHPVNDRKHTLLILYGPKNGLVPPKVYVIQEKTGLEFCKTMCWLMDKLFP
jgi:hypothetical protein